jgi:hypothetical protein
MRPIIQSTYLIQSLRLPLKASESESKTGKKQQELGVSTRNQANSRKTSKQLIKHRVSNEANTPFILQ